MFGKLACQQRAPPSAPGRGEARWSCTHAAVAQTSPRAGLRTAHHTAPGTVAAPCGPSARLFTQRLKQVLQLRLSPTPVAVLQQQPGGLGESTNHWICTARAAAQAHLNVWPSAGPGSPKGRQCFGQASWAARALSRPKEKSFGPNHLRWHRATITGFPPHLCCCWGRSL